MEVKKYQYYAGGVWRDAESGRTFDDLEPYSGKVFAKIAATDFSYIRKDLAIKGKRKIKTNPDLSAEEKKQVFGDNALELFPRFKSLSGT